MNDSQRKILTFIKEYRAEALFNPGYRLSPTFAEIEAALGMKRSTTQHAIMRLEADGFLTHSKGKAASFVPTEKKE